YPLVPGHEIVGTITQKGDAVTLKVGTRVGIGWNHSACLSCPTCLQGDTNICPTKTTTCNGHFGGFADHMVADSRFAFPIPEKLDSAHAAPLLCAGATVYAPLRTHAIQGNASVAVIGVGGLGHLALQFAAAFGCEVTAISHSAAKEAEAKSFGAHRFLTLHNPPTPAQFDFILSTVHADLDWNLIISLLKPKGTLCFVGRPANKGLIDLGSLISTEVNICGSSTANRAIMNEMLSFAARHHIKPKIEIMPLAKVNEGIERIKQNNVRYRIVLQT
ncbi:MAG TPA: NAD(P)-dependent alcohol dehydrogenase, partial [Chlamydiales bacterium]|nr:NAD(P)-dependent alcohol dehydrogenase [Chlamydiales bacterium]